QETARRRIRRHRSVETLCAMEASFVLLPLLSCPHPPRANPARRAPSAPGDSTTLRRPQFRRPTFLEDLRLMTISATFRSIGGPSENGYRAAAAALLIARRATDPSPSPPRRSVC